MATGIGLILIGFAFVALSRPYMEMAAGGSGEIPPPAPKRWPLMRRALHLGKRGGAHLRLGVGQLIGLGAIVLGVVLLLR
ncbi:MAG TPA: hypothetical protein VGI67_17980 [Thermoleophilaceae bacterium]|jgi:hypothetical protein